jgi:FlaA1/EpsC-like NDP-sugar epimerase
MPRPVKRALALLLDAFFCVLTVWLALYLRLEAWVGLEGVYLPAVLGSIALALPIFVRAGLYRTIFRHAGWHAMVILVGAMAVYSVLYAAVFTLISVPGIPRTVGIIRPLLLFVAVGSSRVVVRFFLDDLYRRMLKDSAVPGVLIYGAGSAGRQLASGLRKSREQRVGLWTTTRVCMATRWMGSLCFRRMGWRRCWPNTRCSSCCWRCLRWSARRATRFCTRCAATRCMCARSPVCRRWPRAWPA